MADYLNDSPIEDFGDDRYGVGPFAKALAKCFREIQKPVGTTIALHGPWGSGKSSVVNLIKRELATDRDEKLVVTDFKCWWFRGEEALALAFMQELNATLKGVGDEVEQIVSDMTRTLLQAGPIIGPAVAAASGNPLLALLGLSGFAAKFFKRQTVEKLFTQLAAVLAAQDSRFLIIIDDIDRLEPKEALAIFRMVKSVGRLPNVMYLLVFDRQLAEDAVTEFYPSEGPHFLEKIIQAGFELPQPLQTDLNNAVLSAMQEICGLPPEDQLKRTMNVFYDVVAPYISTPRHVARFRSAITVTWTAIRNEINIADFVALETIRLYEPGLFRRLRGNQGDLCGVNDRSGWRNDDKAKRFDVFLADVPEDRHDLVRTALQRLFPRTEEMGYGSEWLSTWDAERRVCVEKHFNTYFRLTLGDDVLPISKIEEIVENAGDIALLQAAFRQASAAERPNGQSFVPVYLDELNAHANRVPKEKVRPFIAALFEIHDEIDLQRDGERGYMAMANTSLRYHWLIRRLTKDRFTIAERTTLYLAATEKASPRWLIDFVSSARDGYRERNGGIEREDDRLVEQSALAELTERALTGVRALAASGTLLDNSDALYVLFRWYDFTDKSDEPRRWTASLLQDDASVAKLAAAFTGESWSMGMGGFGGLGDRVSMSQKRAKMDSADLIIDVDAFKAALRRAAESATLDADQLAAVRTLIELMDKPARD